jgi:hypothetical protein
MDAFTEERFRLFLRDEDVDKMEIHGFNNLPELQNLAETLPYKIAFLCYFYEENRWQRSAFSRRGYSILFGMDCGLPLKYYPFRGEER